MTLAVFIFAGGARVIAGQGKFLMPGLWDMHVHEMPSPHVPELFAANGVTGIRDMYDDQPKIRDLRHAIQEHRRTGARVVASGRVLNDGFEKDAPLVISSPDEGRQALRQQIQDGIVANALAHRPYTTRGDIFINLYPGRLEVHRSPAPPTRGFPTRRGHSGSSIEVETVVPS